MPAHPKEHVVSAAPAPLPDTRPRPRLRRWIAARRRTAAAHLFRGLCYGTGTGVVSLAVFWIKQHI
jgi:hypothetical protein